MPMVHPNMKSVPKGYKHYWKYHKSKWKERKIRKGLWGFTWTAIKSKKAKSYGNFGKGTKGAWKINAIQYIEKTGKGKYRTKMIGTKKPLKFHIKTPKRYKQ